MDSKCILSNCLLTKVIRCSEIPTKIRLVPVHCPPAPSVLRPGHLHYASLFTPRPGSATTGSDSCCSPAQTHTTWTPAEGDRDVLRASSDAPPSGSGASPRCHRSCCRHPSHSTDPRDSPSGVASSGTCACWGPRFACRPSSCSCPRCCSTGPLCCSWAPPQQHHLHWSCWSD